MKIISIILLASAITASAQNLLICHMGMRGIELLEKHPEIPALDFTDYHGPRVQAYLAAGHPCPTVWPTVVDLDSNEQVQLPTAIESITEVVETVKEPTIEERIAYLESAIAVLTKQAEKGGKLDDLPKDKPQAVRVVSTNTALRAVVKLKDK